MFKSPGRLGRIGSSLSATLKAGVAAAIAYLLQDTFTDDDDTDLTAHTADTGQSWSLTRQSDASHDITIQSNKASLAINNPSFSGYRADATAADGTLSFKWIPNKDGVTGRGFANAFVRVSDASNAWQIGISGAGSPNPTFIQERNGGTNTARDTGTYAMVDGQEATTEVTLDGASITATFDGGNTLSYGSATHNQATTEHGFEIAYSSPSATVVTVDDFEMVA